MSKWTSVWKTTGTASPVFPPDYASDRLTAGWQQGDLNIIAARPSVGKTAFALHLALAAGRAGKHVLVNSLEMQGERLGDRWLCAQAANVDAGHLKTGLLDAGERQQALEAARLLSALPVYVDDNPKMSMDHIRSSALLQKARDAATSSSSTTCNSAK